RRGDVGERLPARRRHVPVLARADPVRVRRCADRGHVRVALRQRGRPVRLRRRQAGAAREQGGSHGGRGADAVASRRGSEDPEAGVSVAVFYRVQRKETRMPTYIVLAHMTQQGVQHAKEIPQRRAAAEETAKELGMTVRDAYLTMGAYDVVLVV